mmetsp:Transcript_770/g.1780  ORF Transcript_770/g.1780 Transcript_770/m.1780 type:complete len:375 (+) Transcript_770:323-1447(+)
MYSGLFGDLPAAKGGGGHDDNTANGGGREGRNKNDRSSHSSQNDVDGHLEQQQQRKRPLPNSLNDPTAGSTKSSKSASLMQSIGTAGTSMAFVPSAALKKKRKQPQEPHQQKTQQSQLQKSFNDDDISKNSNDEDTKVIGAPIENVHSEPSNDSTAGPINNGSISASTVTMTSETAAIATASITTTIVRKSQSSAMAVSQKDHRQQLRQHQDHDDALVSAQREENEDVEEEIMDPYDPYVPNDLLQYWERQAAKLERIELQRQAEEARKTQQLIRERLEQEWQKNQHQISSTQAATTVPSAAGIAVTTAGGRNFLIRTEGNVSCDDGAGLGGLGRGRGRGRGRGVSNLPAWLVEKQRKEAQANLSDANRRTREL